MSGNHVMWTEENRAKAGDRMRARWRDPEYRAQQSEKRRASMADPIRRAEKSAMMTALNERMKTDASLKGSNLAGILRAYHRDPERRRQVGERVKADWARDADRRQRQRDLAASRASDAGRASWEKRRGKIPEGFEDLYRRLMRKVGMKEAMRITREESQRSNRSNRNGNINATPDTCAAGASLDRQGQRPPHGA